jgi:hypothetical protein
MTRSDAMQTEGYMSFLVRLWRDQPGDKQLCDWCGELEQMRKAARRSLWYIGYSQTKPENNPARFDDLLAPFRTFLSELAW